MTRICRRAVAAAALSAALATAAGAQHVAMTPRGGAGTAPLATAGAAPGTETDSITLVLVGDTGFGGNLQPVDPENGVRQGARTPFADLTRDIAAEINGDLAFANLETVVTERNDLYAERKAFVFRMHPNGVRHLMDRGFNLFSTANNHVADFGARGLEDTVRHLEVLGEAGRHAFAGAGRDREHAASPKAVDVERRRILLSAVGIGGGRVNDPGQPPRSGQLAYGEAEDFNEAVARLAGEPGDYRILSAHYGIELDVTPGSDDVAKLRDRVVREAGIDLVVGHHAHVVAGVQEVGGKLIFYGLGNFLHLGTQDMSMFGTCRDYSLLARVHLAPGVDGRLKARAIEVVPLTGTHQAPRRMKAEEARRRVRALNGLARGLDSPEADARGARFLVQPDGTGLHCLPGAELDGGAVGALCQSWKEPKILLASLEREGVVSCSGGDGTFPRAGGGRGPKPTRTKEVDSGAFFNKFFGF